MIASYVSAYFNLLKACLAAEPPNRDFLGKVLAFENFLIRQSGGTPSFAAATTSQRNPVFLSFEGRGRNPSGREDANLLHLIAVGGERLKLFYHYRKQRITKSDIHCLLVYPAVDRMLRTASFRGISRLAGTLVSEWDTCAPQRSELLSSKILIPYLEKEALDISGKPLRILDLGSGGGQLAGQVIARLARARALRERKVELSLVDLTESHSSSKLQTDALLPVLSKVERISDDCFLWIEKQAENPSPCQAYDFAFLFRILHHSSRFIIRKISKKSALDKPEGKGDLVPLSDYYQGLATLFPAIVKEENWIGKKDSYFFLEREFDEEALVLSNSSSLLAVSSRLAKVVLIEDADLTAEILQTHLARFGRDSLWAYDLSKAMRLSRNHFYWITRNAQAAPPLGEPIWPK